MVSGKKHESDLGIKRKSKPKSKKPETKMLSNDVQTTHKGGLEADKKRKRSKKELKSKKLISYTLQDIILI